MKKGLSRFLTHVYQGLTQGLGKYYWSSFKRLLIQHRRRFLRDFYFETTQLKYTEHPVSMVKGLHQLLAQDKRFFFTILIETGDPLQPEYRKMLESAYNQTAPNYEVVVKGQAILGTHILLVSKHDWLRPDLLFRYEQVLRLQTEEKTVLSCHAVTLDKQDCIPDGSLTPQNRSLHLPYEFEPFELFGVLVPKALYEPSLTGYELYLALDLKGAKFLTVPLPLIAERKYLAPKKTAQGLESFNHYIKAKKLEWHIEPGMVPETFRAIPALNKIPSVQVIIPFKDQKALTLQAARSILASQGVLVEVTAVDNGSQDPTLSRELQALGCKVLFVPEPFNYSRLNNLAAKRSTAELILFMNNDVELEPEALLEMCRWVYQPSLGLVGCRLHFPHGPLQHAGVKIDQEEGFRSDMNWIHRDWNLPLGQSRFGRLLHIDDAVTAAAALIQRSHFELVGGFDETFYPIPYSDTNLALKLRQNGLYSFYTPYAKGTHHESVSRKAGCREDFDRSLFLHHQFLLFKDRSQHPQAFYP